MEESGFNCCKKLMIAFNILFLLGGITLLALGIWVVVDFSSFSATLGASSLLYQYAAYISITVGALTIVLSLIGCVGAMKESRCLLIIFCIVLVLFLVIEIAALVMAFVFTSDVERVLSDAAIYSIKSQYGTTSTIGSSVTVAWDFTQVTLRCCGFNGGSDYTGSVYDSISTSAQPWPLSCCALNTVGGYVDSNQCLASDTAPVTSSHSQTGCYPQLRQLVVNYANVVGGVIGGVILVQFLALVFSCCVSSHIHKKSTVEAWG